MIFLLIRPKEPLQAYVMIGSSFPVVVCLLLLEYGLRRLVFRDYDSMTLGGFLRYLRRLDHRILFRDDVPFGREGDEQVKVWR